MFDLSQRSLNAAYVLGHRAMAPILALPFSKKNKYYQVIETRQTLLFFLQFMTLFKISRYATATKALFLPPINYSVENTEQSPY